MNVLHKPSAQLQGALQAERYRILCTQIPTMYAVLLINTGILGFSVYGHVPIGLSLGVPGLFTVLILIRAGIWVTRRRTAPSPDRIDGYLRSTTIVAGIVSLGLGLWGVALLQTELHDQPFVPMFIAFGAIACTYCLEPDSKVR